MFLKSLMIKNINHLKLKQALIHVINNKKIMEGYQKKSWKNFMLSSEISSRKLDNFRKTILKEYF